MTVTILFNAISPFHILEDPRVSCLVFHFDLTVFEELYYGPKCDPAQCTLGNKWVAFAQLRAHYYPLIEVMLTCHQSVTNKTGLVLNLIY